MATSGWSRILSRFEGLDVKKWRKFVLAGLLGGVLSLAIVGEVYHRALEGFFQSESIVVERHRVQVRDGKHIATLVALPQNLSSYGAKSLPLVIVNPGVNNRKEVHFEKAYNFAKWNCVAIAIDARGHGESDGPGTLVDKEPLDLVDVVSWASLKYPQVDPERVGLMGMSLGAANVLVAQTILKPKATVALHPPVNFTDFLAPYEVQKLVGNLASIQTDPDDLVRRSPIYHVTPNNTHDLLLIHGTGDETVNCSNSKELYDAVGGPTRDDVEIILRPGLGHGENERDPTTFRYALSWFLHYLWGEPLDLSTWKDDAKALPVYSISYPQFELVESLSYLVAALAGACGILYFPWSRVREVPGKKRNETGEVVESGSVPTLTLGRGRFWLAAGAYGVFLATILVLALAIHISFVLGFLVAGMALGTFALLASIPSKFWGRGDSTGKGGTAKIPNGLSATSNWRVSLVLFSILLGADLVFVACHNLGTYATLAGRPINIATLHFWGMMFALYCTLVVDVVVFVDLGGLRLSGDSLRSCVADSTRLALLSGLFHFLWTASLVSWWGPTRVEGVPGSLDLLLLVGIPAIAFLVSLVLSVLSYFWRNTSLLALSVAVPAATFLAWRLFQVI
ncbi:MAG: alpha/beta hydrolase family protein [Promethearchaeota archaeon]